MTSYTIKSGDTLSAIAARYGTTVAALATANGISNPNAIKAGASITIPSTTSAAAPAAASASSPGSYKNVAITPGTQAQIQAQMAAIDAKSAPAASSSKSTTTSTPAASPAVSFTSTGDPALDKVLTGITGVANNLISTGYTVPANLQITPALVSAFTAYAHQNIDPYTQQLLSSRIADVNSSLSALGTTYQNDLSQAVQDFGTGLATEQNTSGGNGTAFSGARTLGEENMAASTNRAISTLGANAANQIGSAARSAAADVGSANAGQIVLPTLATGSVSYLGAGGSGLGSTVGGYNTGGNLGYNYDPSIYTVGNIPSAQTGAVNQQTQNYISEYGTLANAQSGSGRSVSDLLGMMSGLPSNYKVPSNLT